MQYAFFEGSCIWVSLSAGLSVRTVAPHGNVVHPWRIVTTNGTNLPLWLLGKMPRKMPELAWEVLMDK